MLQVSAELVYEVLKQLQDRMTRFEARIDRVQAELQALHNHAKAIEDTFAIYAMLDRRENRVDPIDRRLQITEVW